MAKFKRRANAFTDAAVPADLANAMSCVTDFVSPSQAQSVPAEFSEVLRARGLNVHGPIALGNVMEPPSAPASGPPEALAVRVVGNEWLPEKTLRVAFLDPHPEAENRVRQHVKAWEDAAGIKFSFVTTNTATAHVRITFRLANSYSSMVGREALSVPAGRHTMSLGFPATGTSEAEYRRLILHEFGHAVGFLHEHQNPLGGIRWNWAVAIPYYRQRIQFPGNLSETEKNQRIVQQLQAVPNSSKYDIGPFDGESIMLYRIEPQLVEAGSFRPEFGNNNTVLSAKDISTIARVYGKAGPTPPKRVKLALDGASKEGSIEAGEAPDVFEFDVPAAGVYDAEATGDVLLRVTVADGNAVPLPGFLPADSIPGQTLRLPFFLAAGKYTLLVTASEFFPSGTGAYRIRVATRG